MEGSKLIARDRFVTDKKAAFRSFETGHPSICPVQRGSSWKWDSLDCSVRPNVNPGLTACRHITSENILPASVFSRETEPAGHTQRKRERAVSSKESVRVTVEAGKYTACRLGQQAGNSVKSRYCSWVQKQFGGRILSSSGASVFSLKAFSWLHEVHLHYGE